MRQEKNSKQTNKTPQKPQKTKLKTCSVQIFDFYYYYYYVSENTLSVFKNTEMVSKPHWPYFCQRREGQIKKYFPSIGLMLKAAFLDLRFCIPV